MKRFKIALSAAMSVFSAAIIAMMAGTACDDELLPPEIRIDISPVNVGTWSTADDAGPNDFDLQLTNRGESVLQISSVVVKGDKNCAFKFRGPDISELNENQSAFIRGWYQPKIPGEDQISMQVNSNSHVYPTLVVPICGVGYAPGTRDPVQEIECAVPPAEQPDCPSGNILP